AFAACGTKENYANLVADKSLWHPAKAHRVIAKWLVIPELRKTYEILSQRCEQRQTVIAAQTMGFGARLASEKLGVPLATIHRQPAVLRSMPETSRAPYMFNPDWLPRIWKHLQFWILDMLMDHPYIDTIDSFRAELGLPRARRLTNNWMNSPDCVLGLWPDWF